ncbi:MAG: low molecular weight protein-tyrosine-phosphatase [Phycisphaerales bacterium]|jgi:protein-tyrosine phosphatase|nr:low molecular weight phosphotyrosine protein phosphatase [Phycisphaeraceae bacterium]
MPDRIGVLFVCLGNICRSPLAKVIFLQAAERRGVLDRFRVDSCGTGHWHVGQPADPRTIAIAQANSIPFSHTARQLNSDRPGGDFDTLDLLIAMDRANVRTMLQRGAPQDRLRLIRMYDPALAGRPDHELDVPDPYTDDDGFQPVVDMLSRAVQGMLDRHQRGEDL